MCDFMQDVNNESLVKIVIEKKDGTKFVFSVHTDDVDFLKSTVQSMRANKVGHAYYARCRTFDGRDVYLHQLIAMRHYPADFAAVAAFTPKCYGRSQGPRYLEQRLPQLESSHTQGKCRKPTGAG